MNNTMSQTTDLQLSVNEQLVTLNNLLIAFEYLYEEQKNRTLPDKDQCYGYVQEIMNDPNFTRRMRNWISRYKMTELSNSVTQNVKDQIDSHINGYIEMRLNAIIEEKLNQRGL